MSAFNQDSGAKLLAALKRGIENITLNVLNENPRDYHKRGRVIRQDEWGWILSIDNATYTRIPSLERVADYKQGDVVEVMIPNGQPSNMFIMGRLGSVVSSGGDDSVTKEYLNSVLLNYVTNTDLTLALANYVTTANLNDILSGYVTDAKLATQLANYVTTTALNNVLAGYATVAQVDAKYTKPSTGIPKSDLSSVVQSSLDKADSALQTAPVTSVNGKTGAVALTKTDIGLGNVDNTADSTKSVKYATSAGSATKATQDGNGAIITSTYATKTELQNGLAGKSTAKTYDDYLAFVTATNSLGNTALKVGDEALIKTLDVPDMWVTSVNSTKVTYTYVSDEEIENALDTATGLTVGYYTFSKLETGKVDLSGYQTLTDNDLDTSDKTVVGAINELKTNVDNAVDKTSEQTITGYKKFSNSSGIATNRIQNLNGVAVYDFDGTNVRLGQVALRVHLRGKATRPQYTTDDTNFSDIALTSDIPTKVSQLTNDSNYATTTQVNAKYTKPTSGIPKSDFASSVQDSLEKADTALQSAPVTSVNNKTGAVSLTASDVGALPSSTKYVSSVNGSTGAITGIATTEQVNKKQNALTTAQLAAVNSGITATKVTKYDGYETTINKKANSEDLAEVATSGSYNDLLNKPTIPQSVVQYVTQSLTDTQKKQARSNIGAGTSNFDGTWSSLSGKPNVVQTTGDSTSDIMSQAAITTQLNIVGYTAQTTYTASNWVLSGSVYTIVENWSNVYPVNIQTFDTSGNAICFGIQISTNGKTVYFKSSEKVAFTAYWVLRKTEF